MKHYYQEQAKDMIALMGFPIGKRDDVINNLAEFMAEAGTMAVNLTYSTKPPHDAHFFKLIGVKPPHGSKLWVYLK